MGFEIPNRFAIGYGLDYAERYRNLPYVAVLDEPPTACKALLQRPKMAKRMTTPLLGLRFTSEAGLFSA